MFYYCKIPYRRKKTFKNIHINILSHEGEKNIRKMGLKKLFDIYRDVTILEIGSFVRYFLSIVGILEFMILCFFESSQ